MFSQCCGKNNKTSVVINIMSKITYKFIYLFNNIYNKICYEN